jgi:hypothetical protein
MVSGYLNTKHPLYITQVGYVKHRSMESRSSMVLAATAMSSVWTAIMDLPCEVLHMYTQWSVDMQLKLCLSIALSRVFDRLGLLGTH